MRKSFIAGTVIAALFAVTLGSSESQAVVFAASGTGTGGFDISASVEFTFEQHDFGAGLLDAMKISLTNTAATTDVRGNLVTGVFFNISGGVGPLATTSAGFDGLAANVHTDGDGTVDATNVDIAPAPSPTVDDKSYLLANNDGTQWPLANDDGNWNAYSYGIATVGMGLAGFSGVAVNGDDYGIIAAGSFPTSGGLLAVGETIDTNAMFWVVRPTGLTSLSQIETNARITYGSLPDNFLQVVPEPGTIMLLGIGLVGLGAGVFRRRRRG